MGSELYSGREWRVSGLAANMDNTDILLNVARRQNPRLLILVHVNYTTFIPTIMIYFLIVPTKLSPVPHTVQFRMCKSESTI